VCWCFSDMAYGFIQLVRFDISTLNFLIGGEKEEGQMNGL
jgi:hypothetical protein